MKNILIELKRKTAGQCIYFSMDDLDGNPSGSSIIPVVAVSVDGAPFRAVSGSQCGLVGANSGIDATGAFVLIPSAADSDGVFICYRITFPNTLYQPVMIQARTSLKDFVPQIHAGIAAAVSATTVTLAVTAYPYSYGGKRIHFPRTQQTATIVSVDEATRVATITTDPDFAYLSARAREQGTPPPPPTGWPGPEIPAGGDDYVVLP